MIDHCYNYFVLFDNRKAFALTGDHVSRSFCRSASTFEYLTENFKKFIAWNDGALWTFNDL